MTEHASHRTRIPQPEAVALEARRAIEFEVEPTSDEDLTGLLHRWQEGDHGALGDLLPRIYRHLHRLAVAAMRGERHDHTLQATALVNEAYLRLHHGETPEWRDRAHFFAVTARMMRRILVDHARSSSAARRGGGVRATREVDAADRPLPREELLALDQALSALAELRPRQVRVLELRFFAGLSVREVAEVLDISTQSVVLDTRLGKAWLTARMRRGLDPAWSDRSRPN